MNILMNAQSDSNPHILIVTGGIGCGKTTFTTSWAENNKNSRVFCADKTVHDLYNKPGVGKQVAAIAGQHVLSDDGSVNRSVLRTKVFEDAALREKLERLIHPLVREMFQQALSEALKDGVRWILADIPLYFEGGGEFLTTTKHDSNLISTVVVACSMTTQIERLLSRNGFDKERSESIVRSQMPVAEKMRKADFVIWNEGAEQVLHRQSQLLSRTLKVLRK